MRITVVLSLCVWLVFQGKVLAQCGFPTMDNLDDVLKIYANSPDSTNSGAREDVEKILSGYLDPLVWAVNSGSANSWYNTAKTHEMFGFDVNASVSIAWVPMKDYGYLLNDTSLNTVNVVYPPRGSVEEDTRLSTFMGDIETPVFQSKDGRYTYNGIPGTGLKRRFGLGVIPLPVLQGGVGLPSGTDVKIRLSPPIMFGNRDVLLYLGGIGVMHDISQYLNLKDDFEDMSISGFAGYTMLNMRTRLSDQPFDFSQVSRFNFHSITSQVVASLPVSIVTIYSGLGATYTNMRFRILGEYNIDNDPTTFELKDPVDFSKFHIYPKATAGAMLKFSVITVSLDYSFQRYHALTFGVGYTVN
ncbi:MAG: hypothetical protein OEY51_03590 [Cyclobacteriaceae bacterium]|nr:hypothetical protein [Cyclobacteriaceae bacterium]